MAKTIRLVKIWLLTNTAPPHCKMIDDLAEGFYAWVRADHEQQFISAMQKKYDQDPRLTGIVRLAHKAVPANEVLISSVREEIALFTQHVDNPKNWEGKTPPVTTS